MKAGKAFLAQRKTDFGGEGRYLRWFFYLALALPALLVPQAWASHGMHSIHFSLGWPLSGIHVRIGGDGDGRMRLHFLPEPTLLLLVPLWCYIASLAWRARAWARARPDWFGAFLRAGLTSLYGVLVFCFFYGVIHLAWIWKIEQLDLPGIERADEIAWDWLPRLYALGVVGIFAILFLDAHPRPGFLWTAHFIFALCFAFAFHHLAPYLVMQLDDLNSLIQLPGDFR